MKRDIEFRPAFDKRDPTPSKNYGIHCAECKFILSGELGAVQFAFCTGWNLPHVQKELREKDCYRAIEYPMGSDLGYHSHKPMYEGQTLLTDSCPYLDGKPCYYDGSSLNAIPVMALLIAEGGEAVWKKLESYYIHTFGELK